MTKTWQNLVAEKKEHQKRTIPKEWLISPPSEEVLDVSKVPEECGLLSSKEIEITNTTVDGLLTKIAKADWSAVEVTTAFSKRAIIAHQLTNCLTEIFVDRALKRAAELDEHLKRTGKVVGPLHGLPISLKDQIHIEGIETTMGSFINLFDSKHKLNSLLGYVSWIGQYPDKNAVLADLLLQSGAVLYVKTNIPQTLMWPETFNNVFGRTSNPYNRSLTSGGSSGGECALIALKGSPLGVGSDVGGSIRIPSAFCGIYGLRPSYNRVPYSGAANSLEGQDSVPSVFGPISNSISGLKIFLKTILAQEPWLRDPLVVKKKWAEDEYQLVEHGLGGKLCFGVLWHDENVKPHPPIIRGLKMAKQALENAGHKVIDWIPLNHEEIVSNLGNIWASGSEEDYETTAAPTGEPIIKNMDPDATPESSYSPGFRDATSCSAYQLWQLHKRKREFRQEYLDHWRNTANLTGTGRPVDAIIAPVSPFTAPPHGKNRDASYTMVFNALDYPAIVIPISTVDQELDKKQAPHEFMGDMDRENYELYEPSKFSNAPIAFQVVGRTLDEEALLGMAEVVDESIRKYAHN